MGVSWREWADGVLAAGLGPDDECGPEELPPTEIVVNVLKDEQCRVVEGGVDTGRLETHACRSFRAFPMFCSGAASRYAAYWGRRVGEHNVWIEHH